MTKRDTLYDFIAKAKTKQDISNYDYSKSYYKGRDQPITIKCITHGEFSFEEAKIHTSRGKGCPSCNSYSKVYFPLLSNKFKGYVFSDRLLTNGNRKEQLIEFTCDLHSEVSTKSYTKLKEMKGLVLCKICKEELLKS